VIAEADVEDAAHQEVVELPEEDGAEEPREAQRPLLYVSAALNIQIAQSNPHSRNPTVTPESSSLVERKTCW
jgi:hypothetical protein